MSSEFTRKMFADSLADNDNARTLAEVEAEADELWSEIEPMLRTHNALTVLATKLRDREAE